MPDKFKTVAERWGRKGDATTHCRGDGGEGSTYATPRPAIPGDKNMRQ